MGQGLRFRSDDPHLDAFNQDTADRRPAIYGLRQPDQGDIYPENSLPAFLSDYDDRPDPSEFITPLRKQRRTSTSSLILACACGASALISYALVSSDAGRNAFANVEASIAAVFPAPSVAAQLGRTQPTASDTQTVVAPPSGSENSAPAGVKMAAASPSRDDIKSAYQNAVQGSAPVVAFAAEPDPAVQPQPQPQAEALPRLDPSEVAAALTRANALIASGDVAAARLVLRHPADSGDAQAAMRLAETYDPAFLGKLGVHGIIADVGMARGWYEKARKFGAADAARRLEVLASK